MTRRSGDGPRVEFMAGRCEQSVRSIASRLGRAAALGMLVLAASHGLAAEAPASLERLNETERLRLERAQRAYENSRAPLDEAQRRHLQQHIDRQRTEQRKLQHEQLQRQRALEHRLATEPPAVYRHRRSEQLDRDRRRQDQQRLQFELDRKSWPYPPR